jgi:hypothetical protein
MDTRPATKCVQRITWMVGVPVMAAGIIGCGAGVGAQGQHSAAVAPALVPPSSATANSTPPSSVASSAPNPSVAEPAPPIVSGPSDAAAAAPPKPVAACTETPPYEKSARSPDGKTVVFVHEGPPLQDGSVGGKPWEDLCVVTGGNLPRPILQGRINFGGFLFSADGRTLYFSTDRWATSKEGFALDLTTGKELSLDDGLVLEVLARGPYRGMLVVEYFRLDRLHDVSSPKYRGRVITESILRPDGTVVRELPEDARARKKVLEGR